ncbi:Uncharacterized protein Fot_00560 [Forsythia ovata]|uniref:Uncharacterized protein n=1 Tax=Forsythia ovata TaxID=205694 RepID=A0ABD1X1G7_9LAMI
METWCPGFLNPIYLSGSAKFSVPHFRDTFTDGANLASMSPNDKVMLLPIKTTLPSAVTAPIKQKRQQKKKPEIHHLFLILFQVSRFPNPRNPSERKSFQLLKRV